MESAAYRVAIVKRRMVPDRIVAKILHLLCEVLLSPIVQWSYATRLQMSMVSQTLAGIIGKAQLCPHTVDDHKRPQGCSSMAPTVAAFYDTYRRYPANSMDDRPLCAGSHLRIRRSTKQTSFDLRGNAGDGGVPWHPLIPTLT
jgi:hypothetical protein